MKPDALPPALELPQVVSSRAQGGRGAGILHAVTFFFLAVFVILLPLLTKGAQLAFLIAFVVWLISLAVERKGMFDQPLVLPLLAYIVLSGISTALSPEPALSWSHMKLVCYTAMVGTLVAQNLTKLSQVRILIYLLLLSATAAAAITAWQYTYGIGVRVTAISPESQLYQASIRRGDVILRINGHAVHTPRQLLDTLHRMPPGSLAHIDFLRDFPTRRRSVVVATTRGMLDAQSLELKRAQPVRAQGTLGNYTYFAEVLMTIGCLAWAFMLAYLPQRRGAALLFAMMFLAITASVFASGTRAALAGLLAGCLLAVLLLDRHRARLWLVAALVLLAAGATLWIQHTRGLGWIARSDAGTQYRWLMWQDGMRLAVQHPLLGVGMETVQSHWQQWHIRAFGLYHAYWNFHSDFVQIAAERGLLTLAAWLWLVIAYLVFLSRLLRRTGEEDRFTRAVVVGIFSGFVAFLFPSLVQSALTDGSLEMLLFFCFGVAIAMDRISRKPRALDGMG